MTQVIEMPFISPSTQVASRVAEDIYPKYFKAAIKMAKRCPHLYLETSGVSAEDKVVQAVREAGAAKVLYGSDMPFNAPAF